MTSKILVISLFICLNSWLSLLSFGKNSFVKNYKPIEYKRNIDKTKEVNDVVISGNIFNDPDGGNVNNSSGVANLIPNNIYATLVNGSGTVMESVLVSSNGFFSFSSVVEDEYLVLISINQGVTTEPSPLVVLPAGWQSTGEFNGAEDGGTDNHVDGTSEVIEITSNYSTFNFGIKSATALPIDLIYFVGNIFENKISLTWKVENEKDFSFFEIERSIYAKEFGSIGKIEGSKKSIYTFSDIQPIIGKNYYRLKMIDQNGISSHSKIISIDFDNNSEFFEVQNPAINNQFKVFTNLQKPKFMLYSTTAKVLETQTYDLGNGQFIIKIDNAASGIYFLNLEHNESLKTKKVIIP